MPAATPRSRQLSTARPRAAERPAGSLAGVLLVAFSLVFGALPLGPVPTGLASASCPEARLPTPADSPADACCPPPPPCCGASAPCEAPDASDALATATTEEPAARAPADSDERAPCCPEGCRHGPRTCSNPHLALSAAPALPGESVLRGPCPRAPARGLASVALEGVFHPPRG